MYNDVLTLDLPRGVVIVGFADDIVLEVTGQTLEQVEMLATEAISKIENWMRGAKLQIAHHKTEMMLVSNCKAIQRAEITVGAHTIASSREIKYLGVMIDDRLNFNRQVDYVCEKAVKVSSTLARIMPNNYGPSSSKRRLLANVSLSTLRYGCPAWIAGLDTKRNRRKLDSAFRLITMRVVSAYRTISSEAACVIAGMIPVGITLEEDRECYIRRSVKGIRRLVRSESVQKWQHEWNISDKGRWTHRLIPVLSVWVNRKHGEVNFYLTQFLSGHGCFRQYLYRFGHAATPACPECGIIEETPQHVVFECPRFAAVRNEMLSLTVDNVIEEMCREESTWTVVSRVVSHIMKQLQQTWREDQRNANNQLTP